MNTEEGEVQEVTTVTTPKESVVRQTKVIKPVISTGSPQKTYETKKAIFRAYQAVWYVLGVMEVLLLFRFVLKLIGANAYSGFTSFVYAASAPFAVPFAYVVNPTVTGVSVAEWSTVIAMLVYGVIAYGIVALLQFIKPTDPREVSESVDNP